MDVTIQERKFSFASEYDVSTPTGKYHARKKLFSLTDKLALQAEDGSILVHIDGEFSPLRCRHQFRFADGRTFAFRCERLWKRVFTCIGNGETYRLYEHRGLRYSIFLANQQIAAFTKNRIVWGKGNRYEIRMNSNADLLVLLCIALTINSAESDKNDTSVTIDLGNIGPQDRPFDESWVPR